LQLKYSPLDGEALAQKRLRARLRRPVAAVSQEKLIDDSR
jgi:hypothetical protein